MSRYQDAMIDDDEEACPLCIEEFDLQDKNFKPCPCGYQICQFCFNSLKNTYEKSTCPNCRRPYDESTIQYKIPTAEELKLDQLNKNKKAAAAKRKETEKREVEASTRRNLAGVRVKQQNLVYVIGLEPTKKDETSLMETLRGKDYFGQYGPIEKVVVSKPKPGALNQGVGVYVTFKNKEDAATCINCVDGSPNGDKILRAQYGTTKYCSTYLRGDVCQNKNCSFLHENGEDGQSTSLQNEPIDPRPRVPPTRSQPTPQPASTPAPVPAQAPTPAPQPMARENSREGATSRQDSVDGSALPASVGWANTPAVARARRGSQAASTSTASPQLTHATLAHKKTDSVKQPEIPTPPPQPSQAAQAIETQVPNTEQLRAAAAAEAQATSTLIGPYDAIFNSLKSAILNSSIFPLSFDDSCLSPETRAAIAELPPLFDPYGGAKRRILQNKQAEYQAKLDADDQQRTEEQAKSAAEDALDEENVGAGSLALGGEPEENPRSASARGTIGRPAQQTPSNNLPLDQLSNLSLNQGRSLTPQQRQQMAMLNANPSQGVRLHQQPAQNTAFELSDFDRRGPNLSQAQYDQMNSHARHGSRYFNNDTKSNNARFPSQQPLQQQPFYSSGVQGPPPGLPTAGTPPVSGGGMFAHGQGFTSSGFGAAKDSDNLRTRSGTNVGHDVKRGGVEHLAADPSILSARLHQTTASQGLFAANQGNQDYPPLPKAAETRASVHSRVSSIQSAFAQRIRTPKIPPGFERSSSSLGEKTTPQTPPGFENLHAHPPHTDAVEVRPGITKDHVSTRTIPVIPDIPILPKSRKSSLKVDPRPEVPKPDQVDLKPTTSSQTLLDVSEDVVEEQIMPDVIPTESLDLHPATEGASSVSKAAENTPTVTSDITDSQSATTIAKEAVAFEAQTESGPTTESAEKANEKRSQWVTPAPAAIVAAPVTEEAPVVDTPATLSRANTPSPKKQAEKRPTMPLRTLNITAEMLAKSASQTQVPQSTTTEKSAPFSTLAHIRQSSRQPSISVSTNVSRPSTPAASDRLMSRDVSRAGSPPPGGSVIGSAPTRSKTKNQTKKERRDRARKATEVSETGSAVNVPVTPAAPVKEEVGPIVARQKKQKKQKSISKVEEPSAQSSPYQSENLTPQNEINEVKIAEKLVEQVEQEPAEVEASPHIPLRSETPPVAEVAHSFTLRELCRELDRIDAKYDNLEGTEAANNRHKEIQELIQSHITPPQKLLSELVASKAIPKDHPLFTTPHFTSTAYKLPSDSRKGQEYLDANGYSSSNVFGMVYLPTAQKRVLYHGHAVSVHSGGDRDHDLLHRALITPNGTVLRHLGADEGQRVIDLEQGRSMNGEESGELIRMDHLNRLEDDDFINLEGGFDEIIKNGDRHGICWVMENTRSTNARRRAQQAGRRDNVGLEDDYGLGETPVDADEFEDEEDEEGEFDDPEEEDIDEDEEREGEELVNGIDPDTLDDEEDYDSDNLGFDHITTESGMNLPSLPDMNLMRSMNMMPGSWDAMNPSPSHPLYSNRHGMYNSLASPSPGPDFANLPPLPPAPANKLPPMRHPHMANSAVSISVRDHLGVNLRNMAQEQLERRVKEKQRELESSRREAEKAEKALNKKNKDAARWRESVFKVATSIVV